VRSLEDLRGGSEASPAARIRLEHLDGLRGIAALYVVLHHINIAVRFFSSTVQLPHRLATVLAVFNTGQFGVDTFIVLSGYCLMLPVVRSGGVLRGGFGHYIERRAKRILPPYYAALLIFVVVGSFLSTPTATFGDIGTHLLLVHNWSERFVHGIDPPMWSVAMEWQIYFFFPLLLLPVWRRLGNVATLVVAFAIGLAPHYLLAGFLDWTCPWYIGLFALGASLGFSSDARLKVWNDRVPWDILMLASGGGTLLIATARTEWYHAHRWLFDVFIAISATSLLVLCANAKGAIPGVRATILRCLQSRAAVALGAFSYSLYLVHYPLVQALWNLQIKLSLTPVARCVLMFGAGVPVSLLAAYAFHLAFERPFMR
jgi:peptidoglycan/LPS O-acetylase OafA/YrhL